MNPLVVAILVNSALYLGGCFVAGLVVDNGIAWRAALAALALTYLGYLVQFSLPDYRRLAVMVVALSILAGTIAGTALLF